MKNPVRTGTMIALAAASLFTTACKKSEPSSNKPPTTEANPSDTKPAASGTTPTSDKPAATDEKMAKVHCQGVNDCKGKGACKSTANACAGQNGCKGKGFVDIASEDECKTKGGTVTAKM
ncbi:MAG: hypothetical protein WKG01_18620 [Kofleriaceae bacterium]